MNEMSDILSFDGKSWSIPVESLRQSKVYTNLPGDGDWEIVYGNENLVKWFLLKVDGKRVKTEFFSGFNDRYQLLEDITDPDRRDFLSGLELSEIRELLELADYLDIPRLEIDCRVALFSREDDLVTKCLRYIHRNPEKFEPMTDYLVDRT